MSSEVTRYILKIAVTVVLVVLVSEIANSRSRLGGWIDAHPVLGQLRLAALLASLPLTSYLAFIWLYADTGDKTEVAGLSWGILWLVLPSLTLFIALPLLLRKLSFTPSLLIATAIMFACYGATVVALRQLRGGG